MGAYANPQEIEGQFDFTQDQKNLQRMFDTITTSAANSSEKIAELHKANAKKNKVIVDQTEEDGAKLQILLAKGVGKEKTGLNYDCYQDAIKEYKDINTKVAGGIATPEEKRKAAQIVASIDNFSGTAADTSSLIESWDKSMKMVGEGAPDLAGCDHNMIRALNALKSRDGNQIQPGFYQDTNGVTDYSNQGYWLNEYKDADGIEYPKQFISGKQLNSALDNGGASGMVYKKSYSSDNDKVYNAFKIGDDGMGIFEYNKNEPTGKVAPDYLSGEYGKTIVVKKAEGGEWRQRTAKVDQNKILNAVSTQLDAVADASATVTNEVATKYNNYVLPATSKETNPNFDKYNELEDFAKFVPIPGYDKAFPYNKAILTSDEETLKAIRHNNKAAFAQTLKKEQATGESYFVHKYESDAEIKLVSDKKYIGAFDKKFAAQKMTTGSLTIPINIPNAKGEAITRNFIVTKGKDGKYTAEIITE